MRAALRLAASLHVRPLIIGLSLVAFGSSAPQLTVSLQAAYTGAPDVAVGSVIGSNIFNVLVTLGLAALIIPLRVSRQLVRLDIPLMIGASLLVFVLAWNEELTRADGVILLTALLLYLGLLLRQSKHSARPQSTHEHPVQAPWLKSLMMIIAGLAMLVYAGHLLLGAAVAVATDLGLSERIIGLTIVAIGTSLPELASSIVAARKNEHDLALGNIIGSNLFNTLAVVGIAGVISPLAVGPEVFYRDILTMSALTLSLFVMGRGFFGRPGRISQIDGVLLLLAYGAYTSYLMLEVFGG